MMWKTPSVCFLLVKTVSAVAASPFSTTLMSSQATKKICIVGSGPAGFYFAQNLLKKLSDVSIDMYEKLPVPYGLVRYGVAPDHPEVKNVIHTFEKTASNPNFKFIGNVTLGQDVGFSDLKNSYHAVVLAYGCNEDNFLGIPGEKLANVVSARNFVGWYNGLPEDQNLRVDLSCDSVVVLGQGNVAIDVSRILLSPIDSLKATDITQNSLQTLSESKVKCVHLVGRRGPLQAAFTIKEFREMTKLENVQTVFKNEHFSGTDSIIPTLPRAKKRLSELLVATSLKKQTGDRFFRPTFQLRPVEFLSADNVEVNATKFEVNSIDHGAGITRGTGVHEVINCGLVLRSIGYKGSSPDSGIPFDTKQRTVPSGNGVYSTGWINSGPTGVILSTMTNAFDQSNLLIQEIQEKKLSTSEKKPGFSAIATILSCKGVVTTSFNGWKRIDQEEVRRGVADGKPREKIVDINEMLEIGGD